MYTARRAARISIGSLASEAWKAWAVPWKLPWMLGGEAELACPPLDGGDGVAERDAGGEVEGERHGGELRLVVHGQRGRGELVATEGGQRHLGTVGRAHVEV